MAKRTLQQQYVEALMARGCLPVPGRSSGRYITLTRDVVLQSGKQTYYFVGKSGAVRYGVNATSSMASSDKFKAMLLGGTA